MGSFEGYTTSPLYLFNQGTWSNLQTTGVTATTSLTYAGIMTAYGNTYLYIGFDGKNQVLRKFISARLNQTFNLTSYNYIKAYCNKINTNNSAIIGIGISTNNSVTSLNEFNLYTEIITTPGTNILNITSVNGNYYIYYYIRTNSTGLDDIRQNYGLDSLYLTST